MSDASGRAASVRRYVFYNEHRPSRAWMPMLEMINERFSQHLRTALLQHLRPGVEITPPLAVQVIKHGELIERLAVPSYLTLVNFRPLHGMMLVVVDAELISWIVESRFGGNGRFPVTNSNREFSRFERKSTTRVVQTVLDKYALAWRPIASFEPQIVRHETSPQFAGIANSGEPVIVSSFDVRVGQGGGKLIICIPYVMLEPMHDELVADVVQATVFHDVHWHESLTTGVGRATVMLNVELAQIEVTVRDLLGLRPGTVFDLDQPESVTVETNGVPLFRGRWGKHGRKIGVRIDESPLASADALTVTRPEARKVESDGEQ
jgi:flagellar motor switch protein FliM